MASIQIPNLPAVIGLSGAELFEGVQAGTSVKISLDQIIAAARGGTPATLPIPVSLGGTGLDTFTIGDIMYASATQTFSTLSDVALGNAIISGGVGAAPSYGKIGLTTHVSGVLPVANGGTGVTSSTGTGSVVLSDSPALTGNVTVTTNSASAAVTINQTGAGKAFVVEDSASPDASPFVIDASGNVGIGTTSPATQLDLAANNTAGTALNVLRFTDTDLSVTAPQELGKIEFYSADNSAPGAGVKASITGIAEVGNPGGGIAFSTDLLTGTPIERMRIDRNGNVGIGNSSPTAKFEVVTTSGTATAKIWSATNTTPIADLELQRGTNATWGADVYGDYRLRNDSGALLFQYGESTVTTERMRIDASGNVGIGTTSPNGLLELSSAAPSLYFRESDQTVDEKMWRLAPTASNLFLQAVSDDNLTAVDAYAIGRTGTAIDFQLWKTGGSERMRIDASGNVGIGTNSPTSLGTGITTLELKGNSASQTDRAGGINFMRYDGNPGMYVYHADDASYIASLSTYPLLFQTNGNENMRITSAGNVGIGTTTPGSPLEVTGIVTIGNYAVNSNLQFTRAEGTQAAPTQVTAAVILGTQTFYGLDNISLYREIAQIRAVTDGAITSTSSPGYLAFRTTPSGTVATAEAMRIRSDGNVGIGTTSPITPLHVDGASTTNGVVYKAQAAQTSKAAAATLTIAELLTGIIQYTGAVATLTLPTGASIEGGLPATFPTNMSFDVSFINTGAALLTIGANGNTTVGTMTVATLTSAMLRFRKTAANTYTVYRIS